MTVAWSPTVRKAFNEEDEEEDQGYEGADCSTSQIWTVFREAGKCIRLCFSVSELCA